LGQALLRQCAQARERTQALVAIRERDPEAPLRVADDVLQALGYLLLAWAWAAMARAATESNDAARAMDKRALAEFGVQWLLPQADRHWQQVGTLDAALHWT
jgi:hypothetical protein